MNKTISINIPGFGLLSIRTLVSDYTGTLSCGGKLTAGVKERLIRLSELVEIVILTADSFGTVHEQLKGLPLRIRKLQDEGPPTEPDDMKKERLVQEYGARSVAAIGNGNNDRRMLRTVRKVGGLAIAIDNGEGCAINALRDAHIFITGSPNALDLLLEPTRCKATLRF